MFAPRVDQENTIHAHQQAAASKPLNQGLKGLAAKTPARKIPLNDENATEILGGKTGKGLTKNGGGKLDKSAFVTPAGGNRSISILDYRRANGMTRTSYTRSFGHEDDECEGQLPDSRSPDGQELARKEPAEDSQPSFATRKGQSPSGRDRERWRRN